MRVAGNLRTPARTDRESVTVGRLVTFAPKVQESAGDLPPYLFCGLQSITVDYWAPPVRSQRRPTRGQVLGTCRGDFVPDPGIPKAMPRPSGPLDHEQRDVIELGHVPGKLLDGR